MLLIGRGHLMHHDINFLPWRTEKLRNKGKRSLTLFSFFFMTIVIGAIVYGDILNSQIQREEELTVAMRKQLADANSRRAEFTNLRKQRDKLVDKWQWLRDRQIRRNRIVEIMNLVPELIPSRIYLNAIYYQDESVIIKGRSESSDAVDMLLATLHSSLLVDNVHFEFIESDDPVPHYYQRFSLSFSLMLQAQEKGG